MAAARIVFLTLLIAVPFTGCDGNEGDAGAGARPAVIIDEGTMVRLLTTMRQLQDLSRGHPLVKRMGTAGPGKINIGAGITRLLGDACIPILKRNGFVSADQFESVMAYTQMAMQKAQLGQYGGFSGLGRQYQARGALQEARQRLKGTLRNPDLSRDQKQLLEARSQREIERLESDLHDMVDLQGAFRTQYDSVPATNLATVQRHMNELLELTGGAPAK